VEVESSSGSSKGDGAGEAVAFGGKSALGVNKLRVIGVKTPAPSSDSSEPPEKGRAASSGFSVRGGGTDRLGWVLGVVGTEPIMFRYVLAAMLTLPSASLRRFCSSVSFSPSPRMHRRSLQAGDELRSGGCFAACGSVSDGTVCAVGVGGSTRARIRFIGETTTNEGRCPFGRHVGCRIGTWWIGGRDI